MKRLRNLKINTDFIKTLNPCQVRFDNWLEHYKDFEGSVIDFLSLDKITAQDKVWVAVRVLPKDLLEVFAIDCAVGAAANAANAADAAAYAAEAAYANAAADYTAYAADYTAYAADVAADAAAYANAASDAERERQVDALIYLIENYER